MADTSADLHRQIREEDEAYERECAEVLLDLEAAMRDAYERWGLCPYPGGGFFGAVDDIAYLLRHESGAERQPVQRKRRISAATRKRIFERDAYRCVRCGGWEDLSIDHRIPESKGGTDDDENLQTMCLPCNRAKGAS